MHVDPVRPTLKAPGIKHLKLSYEKPPSNFAVKLSLRRYNEVAMMIVTSSGDELDMKAGPYTRPR